MEFDKELIKQIRTAVKSSNIEEMKRLFAENEGLLNATTYFGTWLHDAASYGQYEAAKYLIEQGKAYPCFCKEEELDNWFNRVQALVDAIPGMSDDGCLFFDILVVDIAGGSQSGHKSTCPVFRLRTGQIEFGTHLYF